MFLLAKIASNEYTTNVENIDSFYEHSFMLSTVNCCGDEGEGSDEIYG
jgi:hypothetical protein